MIAKLRSLILLVLVCAVAFASAQAPNISYSSPQVYTVGTAIPPLTPVNSGGVVPVPTQYNVAVVDLGGVGIGVDNDDYIYFSVHGGYIYDEENYIVKIPQRYFGSGTVGFGLCSNTITAFCIDRTGSAYTIEGGTNGIIQKTSSLPGASTIYTETAGENFISIAADATGNLFVIDASAENIKKISISTGSATTVASGFNNPTALTVDSTGNVYVVDQHPAYSLIKKIPPGGSPSIICSIPSPALVGIAIDEHGNIYMSSPARNAILKIPAHSSTPVIFASGLDYPTGVAVDPSGYSIFTFLPNESVIISLNHDGYAIAPALPPGLTFDAGTGIITGTPTTAVPAINYTVAADNTVGRSSTTVRIQVISGSVNLTGLSLSSGSSIPAFDSTKTSYVVTESSALNALTVTPTASDPTSIITVNGTAVASGAASYAIPIPLGSKTIDVKVRSFDHKAVKDYIITVIRPVSTNAALAAIAPSNGVLLPPFDPNVTSYTAEVSNSVSAMTVRPVTADPTATVTVNGVNVKSATKCAPIPLSVGSNTITIVVTAQDGVTTTTYTITVTRDATGGAALSELSTSDGTLSPVFNYLTTSYNTTVPNAASSLTVTPTAADITAVITVNGTMVASGSASGAITLAEGNNTITIAVTSHGGRYSDSYTIDVYRVPGGADAYTGISVKDPTEHPSFDDDVLVVHKGVSPNGDGIDDYLVIDGILAYPDNKLSIMNRNGQLIYEATDYDNTSRVFDGHSNKNGQMQLPGTYFYELDYTVKGITKHKTGYLVLKY